ncbi:MAG: hypothetical protein WCG67_02440 [Ferruginibacter sp.]
MKKIIAILLISIYFISGTVTSELLKLPLLADHYYDHKEEKAGTSLISFIIEHYCQEDGTDKDAAEDSKLPFKGPENLNGLNTVYINPPIIFQSFEKPLLINNMSFFIRNDEFISVQFLAAIWQPPRNC